MSDVPAHWEVRRLKHVLKEREARSTDGREQLLRVSQYSGVTKRAVVDGSDTPDTRAESLIGYKCVERYDFVVNIMLAWNGSMGVSKYRGIVSPAYCVYGVMKSGNPWFFHYLFRSENYKAYIKTASTGVVDSRLRLYTEDLYCLYSVVPPLPEQAAIVRYLDHVGERIRRYVSGKQRLIRLLEEEKQAVIHRAVTRGLDPNVSLKPSGVEWLGDIPAHWEVAALRHRYSQCLGKMLDSKRITGSHLLPYLRNTDIQWDRINTEGLSTMDISPDEYDRYTVRHGDLLVCEGGEVGRCAIWSDQLTRCGFQKALHRLRPLNAGQDVVQFMYYSLRVAAKSQAFNDGQLSTIAHLTGEKLRTHRFPFPTFHEQNAIVRYLDKSIADIDVATSHARRQIELLQDYRTRLIADVVTGKLDVRGMAKSLPEIDSLETESRPAREPNEAAS